MSTLSTDYIQKQNNYKLERDFKTRFYYNSEEFLNRKPIELNCDSCSDFVKGKNILVTGGGGTIGSEICRQVCRYEPESLIILDHYENSAYEIQQELSRLYGNKISIEIVIASIQDYKKMSRIFANNKINIVFHAAAHKHVPLMERNPEEAIKNNIIGTYNIVVLADRYNVDKFVLISTDKAVNPRSVMGATKKICELIIQSFNKHSKTDFVAVRFGNVLGSNGSVIPLFIDQILNGGPITITHEDITRYFMTIPEAVKLVLIALSKAKGGEIFVLDMGNPIKIKDLAKKLIELYGLRPEVDIKIEYTGLRSGEKLHEELLITDNDMIKVNDKIFIERPDIINEHELFECITKIKIAAENMDLDSEIELLKKLVPQYKRTLNNKEINIKK